MTILNKKQLIEKIQSLKQKIIRYYEQFKIISEIDLQYRLVNFIEDIFSKAQNGESWGIHQTPSIERKDKPDILIYYNENPEIYIEIKNFITGYTSTLMKKDLEKLDEIIQTHEMKVYGLFYMVEFAMTEDHFHDIEYEINQLECKENIFMHHINLADTNFYIKNWEEHKNKLGII